jgi:hypothetical protein
VSRIAREHGRIDGLWTYLLLLLPKGLERERRDEEAVVLVDDGGPSPADLAQHTIEVTGHRFPVSVVVKGLARCHWTLVRRHNPLWGNAPKKQLRRAEIIRWREEVLLGHLALVMRGQ